MDFKPSAKTIVTELRSYTVDAVSKVGVQRQTVSAPVSDTDSLANLDVNVSTLKHYELTDVKSIFSIYSPEPIKIILTGAGQVPPEEVPTLPGTTFTGAVSVPSTLVAGQPLAIVVTDEDLDISIPSIDIVAYNSTTGETESLQLTRNSTDQYVGTLTTDDLPTVGVNFDGRMGVSMGHNLRIIYSDANNAAGQRQSIEKNITILSPYTTAVLWSRDTIQMAKPIPIILTDIDTTTPTATVLVRNLTTGEQELVTLTNSVPGEYKGSLTTGIYNGTSFTDNDGRMEVLLGHQIQITYNDSHDLTGSAVVVVKNLEVTASSTDTGTLVVPAKLDLEEYLNITVYDYDKIGQPVAVTVSNVSSSEFETVLCTETVYGSGVFAGKLLVSAITTTVNELGVPVQDPPVNENNILLAADADQLRSVYIDAATSTGASTVSVEKITTVVDTSLVDDVTDEEDDVPDDSGDDEPTTNDGLGTVEFRVTGAFLLNGSYRGTIRIEGLNIEPTRCTILHV